MSNPLNQLDKIIKRLNSSVADVIDKKSMTAVGKFAVTLIVKRTRLGYGVNDSLGQRSKLRPLSPGYIKQRKNFPDLNQLTRPSKSNLTRTGQMLESMTSTVKSKGSVVIAPTGIRDDGQSNMDIARYNAERGRIFNNVSELEFKQLVRFYRKTFGDLLRLRKLIT